MLQPAALRTALALTAASCFWLLAFPSPSLPSRLISRFPYLSRAIKGNETGKPKLSPAGKCLPIPKPFRSSLFRGGTSLHSPWRKQVCGYVDDNRPIRTFVCWNLLLSESFGKPWWSHIIIIINSLERKRFLQGKASRLLPKSGHRPVMRLVEDSLPSGVGTNKESRKQLPAIRRSTTLRSACKGRSAYSLRWQSSPLDANCRINTRQYRSAFFDRRSPDQNWKDIPAPEGLSGIPSCREEVPVGGEDKDSFLSSIPLLLQSQ